MNAQIAKIRAEAELYASQTRAKADKEVNVAQAEAKRLKADALNTSGGRYVVALETAKMFENIEGAVMTPEQYISFIRNAWAVIGVSPGSVPGRRGRAGGGEGGEAASRRPPSRPSPPLALSSGCRRRRTRPRWA